MRSKAFVLILSLALLSLAIPAFAQDTATPVPATTAPSQSTIVPVQQATAVPAQPTAAYGQQVTPAAGTLTAFIRFANFVPGASITFTSDSAQPLSTEALDYKAFSEWVATQPGKFTVTASSSGTNAAKSQPTDFDFKDVGWFTVSAVAGANGNLHVEAIDQSFDKILPGTSSMTLVNAIQGNINIDIIRNDTTYIANLFPLGNDQNETSWTKIPDDVNTYHYKVTINGKPDQVLVDAPNTEIRENELYLIAAVGDPSQPSSVELVVNNTGMAQIDLLQGKMQQPGTIIQAAQARPELAAWVDAVQKAGLTDMLSGKGPFTVFVNANFDISKLPDNLRKDPKVLADFLKSQIVQGDLRSKDIFKAGTLNTLTGHQLTLTQKDNNGFINNAQVIEVNIPATNGDIQVVNDFVTPPPQ